MKLLVTTIGSCLLGATALAAVLVSEAANGYLE